MKIEIAKFERMSESGSSLIRLIQNNEMPVIDLLVREAVQNSLDAAKPDAINVDVSFNIRTFNRSSIVQLLDGIGEQIEGLYSEQEYRLLEIRDCNTVGLTGPLNDKISDADQYGNLIKLIYQVGMPQQKEGSGGSWGIGKTVYYRLGIGLVIYYSRIFENGSYQSRLAACLVEDQTRPEALLANFRNNRGIAWWGDSIDGQSTQPIISEADIEDILYKLGAQPYSGTETGTTIIIPFLRDDLRAEFDLDNEEVENSKMAISAMDSWWTQTDEGALEVALQRWYAPRLMNSEYTYGAWLRASVNGKGIGKDQFLPVFSLVQRLYNEIWSTQKEDQEEAVQLKEGSLAQLEQGEIGCLPIKIRSEFVKGQTAGWVAFSKVTAEQLLMGPPHNYPSPWIQIFGKETGLDQNPAIITFTRKPGMLVGYEYSGHWTDGISRTGAGEYILGIFVANSNNPLNEQNPKSQKQFLLEEYIRGCEKADHTSWGDWTPNKKKKTIIERIQKNVRKQISQSLSDKKPGVTEKKETALGRMLASVLMPPEGFGQSAKIQKQGGSGGGSGSGATGRLAKLQTLSSPKYEAGLIKYDFELFGGKTCKEFDIRLKVLTESGEMNADVWESDEGIGSVFPYEVTKLEIHNITGAKNKRIEMDQPLVLDHSNLCEEIDQIRFELSKSSRFQKCCTVSVHNGNAYTYSGSIWLSSSDRKVSAAIQIDSRTGGN
ncbi:hypothetical protein SAMN05216378_4394 [Paenibacillus catalpae]|uniref:Histidine kinase-, DNA gyrase B-, and HSP90-like ATPase n=1 Tax=Paenibacillus catalpae TaxID=1045775 RepID=A0A1I2E2S4_9BACL|nr:hypothetical protein [Paenibacillus catalpae]SFE86868.1 hypothetical protein SAMN05216378_4394 [Paenibacillus catalpae]